LPEARARLLEILKDKIGLTISRGAKRINIDWSQRLRTGMGGKVLECILRHQFA
jgi:hypothetical protein